MLIDTAEPRAIKRLVAAGADQVVPVGVQADRIVVGAACAAAAHTRIKSLQDANEQTKLALASMKLVARAKGVLMSRQGLSEPEAHRRLQQLAMQRSQPLAEAARAVIAADELLEPGVSQA